MLTNIDLKQTIETKHGNRWVVDKVIEQKVDEQFYRNVVNAKKFFRNLGVALLQTYKKKGTRWQDLKV